MQFMAIQNVPMMRTKEEAANATKNSIGKAARVFEG